LVRVLIYSSRASPQWPNFLHLLKVQPPPNSAIIWAGRFQHMSFRGTFKIKTICGAIQGLVTDKGELRRICSNQVIFIECSILSMTSFVNVRDQTGLSLKKRTKKNINYIQLKMCFFFSWCHYRFS
jgi:hypothetical protein